MKPILSADLEVAARTVWGEGRGETYQGKRAIAHVMINRWNVERGQFKKDHMLGQTCQRWLQFSAWNSNDPNRAKLLEVDLNDRVYRQSMKAVLESLNAKTDPTLGATHYHVDGLKPYWAKGRVPVTKIGHHIFYTGIR